MSFESRLKGLNDDISLEHFCWLFVVLDFARKKTKTQPNTKLFQGKKILEFFDKWILSRNQIRKDIGGTISSPSSKSSSTMCFNIF